MPLNPKPPGEPLRGEKALPAPPSLLLNALPAVLWDPELLSCPTGPPFNRTAPLVGVHFVTEPGRAAAERRSCLEGVSKSLGQAAEGRSTGLVASHGLPGRSEGEWKFPSGVGMRSCIPRGLVGRCMWVSPIMVWVGGRREEGEEEEEG